MRKEEVKMRIMNELRKSYWSPKNVKSLLKELRYHPSHEQTERVVTVNKVKEKKPVKLDPRELTLEDAFNAMYLAMGVTKDEIKSRSRVMDVKISRQVLMTYLSSNNHTGVYRPTNVAKMLGGKNHGTINHSIRKVQDMIETKDKKYAYVIEKFLEKARLINPNITDKFDYQINVRKNEKTQL